MGYEYDVFFSYKRDPESNEWHKKVKDKLAFWLRQELPKENVKIFFDTKDITTGSQWRQTLANALKRSRCMACVWSPLYFQSKWCVSEWMTFLQREELKKVDLVAPASYFDGENFPPQATARQFLDFSEFASTMPNYWQTESAVRFENLRLRPFARDLAAMIRKVPDFDETFPVVEVPDGEIGPAGSIGRPADA